jgi:hypothetical protein
MSTMFGWARLSFRLQRLEILLLTAAVLVASGLMVWFGLHLNGLSAAYPDCDFADPARSCRAAGETFGSASA